MSRFRGRATRSLALLTAAALTVAAAACGGDAGGGSGDVIKIGANTEATGASAVIGGFYDKGIELAVALINEEGGVTVDGRRHTIELVQLNNETDPQKAMGNMQQLVRDDVKFVFGPAAGALAAPILERFVKEDIFIATYGITSVPHLGTPGAEDLFHTQPPTEHTVRQLAKTTAERFSAKSAALLLPQDPSGQKHADYIAGQLGELGVEVVYRDLFDPATRDFSPFIAAIRQKSPDLVFTGYLDSWVKPILDAADQSGLTGPAFVGTNGTSVGAFAEFTKFRGAVNVPSRAVHSADDPRSKEYRDAWAKHFGSPPDDPNTFWSLAYYDTVRMLAKAIEQAGTADDVKAIARAMRTDAVRNYPVRVLDLSFDEKHQAHAGTQVALIDKGVANEFIDIAAG